MKRRYETEMVKGKSLIADPGLEHWNEITAAQFDEDVESEIERLLEDKGLVPTFVTLKEMGESPLIVRIEPITLNQRDYFLEKCYSVYGMPIFILHDENYRPLFKSDSNIDTIVDYLGSINPEKS